MGGFLRRTGMWVLLVAGLAVCAALGFAAYQMANYSWDQIAEYRSPYIGMLTQRPASRLASPAPAPRVVLVIVDGLRDDAARRMGTLNTLAGYGSDYVLVTPEPSLSYPDWTTILTGAPHNVTEVTTNYREERVKVPTLVDVALAAGIKTAVVGPTSFQTLYDVDRADAVQLREWPEGGYLSGTLIDDALRAGASPDVEFLLVHLPDVDEAGHDFGGASAQYAEVVSKVDADLGRLVAGLSDERTAFVILSDHGHIDTGGHGGWEPAATRVRAVFAGSGVALGSGEARLEQVAPTVAALMGLAPPEYSKGAAIRSVMASMPPMAEAAAQEQQQRFTSAYTSVLGHPIAAGKRGDEATQMRSAERVFINNGRVKRLPWAIVGWLMCIVALAVIGAVSWRALAAAAAGGATYLAVYNVAFFALHRFAWSLSAFNSEDKVKAFMNGRLLEAALSLLAGVVVASLVYPLLRSEPKGPKGEYLAGWLALGPVTAVVVLAGIGAQVFWYIWMYGAQVTHLMPNLKWGFKYDLDLLQATAVGFAALLTPLVSYLVGRYHPRNRKAASAAALAEE